MAKWVKGYEVTEIINRMDGIRSRQQDGSIRVNSHNLLLFKAMLYPAIEFEEKIPEIDGREIIRKAIISTRKDEKFTKSLLLKEINLQEKEYLSKPNKRYVITSSLSLCVPNNFRRIYVGNTQIIIEPYLPNRFAKEEENIKKDAASQILAPAPENYASIRIHVTAKTLADAFDRGVTDFDLIRSIWNFHENRPEVSRISFMTIPNPINKIILGPFYFFHYPSGKLITEDTFWIDRNYLGAIKPHNFKSYEIIDKFTSKILKKISNSTYKEELVNSLIRYSRALDESNLENAFINLWSVLEKLTAPTKNSHKEAIERAAYIYSDKPLRSLILKQLMNYRNDKVHSETENSDIEVYLYQLKNVVEDLIIFHLGNKFNFQSLEEVGTFLCLPHDINSLERREEMARYALQYFSKEKISLDD